MSIRFQFFWLYILMKTPTHMGDHSCYNNLKIPELSLRNKGLQSMGESKRVLIAVE